MQIFIKNNFTVSIAILAIIFICLVINDTMISDFSMSSPSTEVIQKRMQEGKLTIAF